MIPPAGCGYSAIETTEDRSRASERQRRKGPLIATFDEDQGFCEACKRNTLIRKKGVNHVLHLLMSVITAGMWLPVWFFVTASNSSKAVSGWRCSTCGDLVNRHVGTTEKLARVTLWVTAVLVAALVAAVAATF